MQILQHLYRRGSMMTRGVITTLIGLLFLSVCQTSAADNSTTPKKFKVLHVPSYHMSWKWNEDQFKGFNDALKDLDIEYKIFEMDTKRKSTLEWKEQVSKEARELIDTWQPDLVYTNDDNAQEYVAKYYVNHKIPFVFSGVNATPEKYGFPGSRNITGILEQEHIVQSVKLLKELAPGVKKIAVVFDDDPTWPGVVQRMKDLSTQLVEVEFVHWDAIATFAEYQQKIKEYQTTVDAIALLGVFTFKDAQGKNVPYTEVLKWTAENSALPDFSFWRDRPEHGTLCAVAVSGYAQGLQAGKMAHGILAEGKSPVSYVMEPTIKGEPIISLARVKKLGLPIKTNLLLSAEVRQKFSWER